MQVKILTATPDPIMIIYKACRTCYSFDGPLHIEKKSREQMLGLIEKVVGAGHHSVLEHVTISIAIDGVSRALTHQLVRHRLASYSQQSQRYVNFVKGRETDVKFVTPPTVSRNSEANQIYEKVLSNIADAYRDLIERGIPAEDARYLLPNAAETKLIMTMNLRELINVSSLRLCQKAQWEIVNLFRLIKREIVSYDQFIASLLKPKCQHAGFCTEQEPCGQYSFKKAV